MNKKKFILTVGIVLKSAIAFPADFNRYFPHLLKAEGVLFTVTQYDRGGATKYGVTLSTYKRACLRAIALACDKDADGKVSAFDLALTTQQDIKPIYKAMYWNYANAQTIHNQAIAETIVDILVNCGPGKNKANVKAIQRIVGATPDGVFGTATIRKINKANPRKLYSKIYQYRTHYYQAIGVGTQRKFLRGWLNRIENLKKIHLHEKYI